MKIAEQEVAITDLREELHGLRQFVDARPSIYTEAIGNAMANSNNEADRLRNRIIELEARQQGTPSGEGTNTAQTVCKPCVAAPHLATPRPPPLPPALP